MEGQIAYRGLPGVVVGVVSDQELVWATGFGFANVTAKQAMTPATKFRMASHSKLFTSTAIMQLREQGKIRLDDPVVEVPPLVQGSSQPVTTMAPSRSSSCSITRPACRVRQATTGRRSSFRQKTRCEADGGPAGGVSAADAVEVLEPRVHDRRNGCRAGEREKWADYVQKNIFGPLGMTRIECRQERARAGRRLHAPHAGWIARGLPIHRRARHGLRDWHDIERRRHGEVRLGTVPRREDGRPPDSEHRLAARDASRALRGERLDFRNGDRVRGQSGRGRTYVGHGGGYPGYTTQTTIQLDDKVAVIVLTNTNDSNPNDIARQLMSTVGVGGGEGRGREAEDRRVGSVMGAVCGTLPRRGRGRQVVLLNRRLVVVTPNAGNVDNPVTLEPLGGGQFRYVAPGGGGPVGEVVRFVEENGRVMRMITGDSYVDRVNSYDDRVK